MCNVFRNNATTRFNPQLEETDKLANKNIAHKMALENNGGVKHALPTAHV